MKTKIVGHFLNCKMKQYNFFEKESNMTEYLGNALSEKEKLTIMDKCNCVISQNTIRLYITLIYYLLQGCFIPLHLYIIYYRVMYYRGFNTQIQYCISTQIKGLDANLIQNIKFMKFHVWDRYVLFNHMLYFKVNYAPPHKLHFKLHKIN